jgi:hypothetical protein
MCWWMPRNKVIGAIIFLGSNTEGQWKKYVLSNWIFFQANFPSYKEMKALKNFLHTHSVAFSPLLWLQVCKLKAFRRLTAERPLRPFKVITSTMNMKKLGLKKSLHFISLQSIHHCCETLAGLIYIFRWENGSKSCRVM